MECLAASSLIWKQLLSISDCSGPKLLPWTTTEMAAGLEIQHQVHRREGEK